MSMPATPTDAPPTDDEALLARFADQDDREAMAELVARHPDAAVRASAANALSPAMLARNGCRGAIAARLTAQLARETDADARGALEATLRTEMRASVSMRSPQWSDEDEVVLVPLAPN